MTELVADCPICGAQMITFTVLADSHLGTPASLNSYESFCICRACGRGSIFSLTTDMPPSQPPRVLLSHLQMRSHVRSQSLVARPRLNVRPTPAYVPEAIAAAFAEGAVCLAEGCWTAAGVMFRKSMDLATLSFLPPHPAIGLKVGTRRILGQRLRWLFENNLIPKDLETLSTIILEDGNDGAHGPALTEADALDLSEFAQALLERLYTEPEKLRAAEQRRLERRK